MLAGIFVRGGIDAYRNPGGRVLKAEELIARLPDSVKPPGTPEQLVKANALIQAGAGALLSAGRLPRLAALVLAGTLVPTTLADHPFWREKEPIVRDQQQIHFLKSLGLLGGLVIAAFDTEGSPGLSWRAKRTAKRAGQGARHLGHTLAEVTADVTSSLPHVSNLPHR